MTERPNKWIGTLLAVLFALTAILLLILAGPARLALQSSGRSAVEAQVADWLLTNTADTVTLLADERIAALADRTAVGESPQQLEQLQPDDLPQFVVSGASMPWQLLQEAIWFRLYYQRLAQFSDPTAPQAERKIWGLRSLLPGMGAVTLLNAHVPDRLAILGVQIEPDMGSAGETFDVGLYLERPEASAEDALPMLATFRLVSPLDGSTASEWTAELPQSTPIETWQPGQVIRERISSTLPEGLPPAAYLLNLSLAGRGDEEFWPFARNNDVNRLDRIPLGYILVPQASINQPATTLDVHFENGILLEGASVGTARAGDVLLVDLHWTTETPLKTDYAAFVHLLNSDGVLVSNHDGLPAEGRFPTSAWLPGLAVLDTHAIPLSSDLEDGVYELRAGLYDATSGQRLAIPGQGDGLDRVDSVSLGMVAVGD